MTLDVVVIGAGPAGVLAALRAADLGARTALVTRGDFGGMAANDGPVPVRTLAHAARLMRDARQLGAYGIAVGEPVLKYPRLLERVHQVVQDVRGHSALRAQLEAAGVTIHERAGRARFVDPHTMQTERGPSPLRSEKWILCTGGVSRRLSVPGSEWTCTHSDAWSLTAVPQSILVVGAGATGVQVASVFRAFGSKVQLFEAGPRILASEDQDVSASIAAAFRESGIAVQEDFGAVESFEKVSDGVRMVYEKDGARSHAEVALAIIAIGWRADAAELNVASAGVETDSRGFLRVDAYQRTSAPHVFAAGDVTGDLMFVPEAMQAGFVAGTNAVKGATLTQGDPVRPIGSFTDPEYARVGLTELKARERHDVLLAVVSFGSATRAIIDGRTTGFCKLIVERRTRAILGCHVVGERAVDIVQVAAVAIAGRMRVEELARLPLSFPTYAGTLGRAAAGASRQLGFEVASEGPPIDELASAE
jgi:dihydrolipoamide dehydrogenase